MKNQETIAEKCKNPLNIRYASQNDWRGQVGVHKGFCVFENEAYGFRAAFVIIGNYIKKGHNTIREIVSRWAPPSENNTDAYIEFVSEETIIDPDFELTDNSIHDYWTKIMIIRAMARMESGKWYDEQSINLMINYPEKYA